MSGTVSVAETDESSGLLIRLAETAGEIEAAQRLRYRVFYEEMGAQASPETLASGLDRDSFDDRCDHLLVVDPSLGAGAAGVVGTYRLMRRESPLFAGFYSAAEFDLTSIHSFTGNVLELGRSCVDARYRNTMTMQLLWRGIAGYVFAHNIDLMFGCASFPGTDPDALAQPLSYLYWNHLAPADFCPRALPDQVVAMNRLPADGFDARRVLAKLPPLVKGYLRLGGFIGDGAVIDHQFNTVDVCVIVKTDLISEKYARHYDRTAQRDLAAGGER